jgi:hypothetical protein
MIQRTKKAKPMSCLTKKKAKLVSCLTPEKTQIPKPSQAAAAAAAKNHPSHPLNPDDYQVFQSCKNFWKIRRVAKTDWTEKNDNNP